MDATDGIKKPSLTMTLTELVPEAMIFLKLPPVLQARLIVNLALPSRPFSKKPVPSGGTEASSVDRIKTTAVRISSKSLSN
ncbi:unnamed protein product [Nezara viridula]|uniref:Uncharacterized protein n=1 Tax=Nezara viridula TaxID=85310 RepID=A0A9P0HDM2_NEZVI|nr:unnamed protein product [Nezara viridula]